MTHDFYPGPCFPHQFSFESIAALYQFSHVKPLWAVYERQNRILGWLQYTSIPVLLVYNIMKQRLDLGFG